MAEYSSLRKRRRSFPVGLMVVILIVVVVTLGGAAFGVWSVMQTVDTLVADTDIPVQVSVSGNDVVVCILAYPDTKPPKALRLSIAGYTMPAGISTRDLPPRITDPVVYPNMAVGISGMRQVSVYAIFSSGSESMIWLDDLKFV